MKEEKVQKPTKVYTVCTSIDFRITSEEAYEVLKNPKGKVAKGIRKYLSDFLIGVSKKCLAYEKEEKEKEKLEE